MTIPKMPNVVVYYVVKYHLADIIFLGLALGMWLGPRMLQGLSRRRLFGLSLTAAGVLLVGVALIPDLALVAVVVVVLGFCAGTA